LFVSKTSSEQTGEARKRRASESNASSDAEIGRAEDFGVTSEISLPVAITVFPDDVYRAPETWARRAYRNLSYFHEVDKGGHFAAWEQPELFSAELRAAFGPLRR